MSQVKIPKNSSPYEKSKRKTENGSAINQKCSWCRRTFIKFIKFCQAYGAICAYYGAGFGALFAAISVTITNEFEGGCKYPYLSEVCRNGLGWWCFYIGTLIGYIPWIIFSWDYYKVFCLNAMSIENESSKRIYLFLQKVVLIFNILSAIGMHSTAFFDMGHYPLTHEISVILFAVPLNLLFIINYYQMIKFANQRDFRLMMFKLFLLIGSFGGILGFTLLGRIEHCKSVVISIEECLHLTSETECYKYIDPYNDGWTVVRNYPRCHTMHFWRGFLEYIAVLFSAEYVLQLYYDRNFVQHSLFTQYGILPTNSYILKELSQEDEAMVNQLTPSTVEELHL